MIVAKNFNIVPERNISIQLRLESDNVFNHTQFNNPTSSFTSSNFGVITYGRSCSSDTTGSQDLLLDSPSDHKQKRRLRAPLLLCSELVA